MFERRIYIKTLCAAFILLITLAGNADSFAAKTAAPTTPEQAAATFYKWYIGELNAKRDPRTEQKKKLLGYLSKRFGKWVYSIPADEHDADVFINAQDWDDEWARLISTTKAVVRGNAATLTVNLGVDENGRLTKSKWKHQLRLKMVKEAGAWKIDRVD